jgi:hypothetical protein
MADLGEEDRMRHRRVVNSSENPSIRKVWNEPPRLARGDAGRHRPVVARDAVDGDGHLLVVLVDGDGDPVSLAPVANSMASEATRRNAFYLWPQASLT